MALPQIPFTPAGFNKIKQEYEELQQKRPEVVKELTRASEMGDRSENAAYKVGKRKLSQTDSRLRFLKRIIDNAKVITPTQTEYVEIGSLVLVNNGSQDITFYIVGEHEADPLVKKLSFNSPVGRALMGRKVGQTVDVQIPSGMISYHIIGIKLS